jgi:hypothetical protein
MIGCGLYLNQLLVALPNPTEGGKVGLGGPTEGLAYEAALLGRWKVADAAL